MKEIDNSLVECEQEQSAILNECFIRCYRLLHFIACRALGDDERSAIAIQNCWRTGSRNPPHFNTKAPCEAGWSEFYIDEALAILYESKRAEDTAPYVVNAISKSDNMLKPMVG